MEILVLVSGGDPSETKKSTDYVSHLFVGIVPTYALGLIEGSNFTEKGETVY